MAMHAYLVINFSQQVVVGNSTVPSFEEIVSNLQHFLACHGCKAWLQSMAATACLHVPVSSAGKSTLINAVVGQKLSIVTFKPQTTRHRVVGIASGLEYQMILFDTPGIMQVCGMMLPARPSS